MNRFRSSQRFQQRESFTSSPPCWLERQHNQGGAMATSTDDCHSMASSTNNISPAAFERAGKRQRVEPPSGDSPHLPEDDLMPMHPPCIQRLALPTLTHTPSEQVAHAKTRTFRQFRR